MNMALFLVEETVKNIRKNLFPFTYFNNAKKPGKRAISIDLSGYLLYNTFETRKWEKNEKR